ncbi:MAG TPA: class GN sortase [Nitrospira sp.]
MNAIRPTPRACAASMVCFLTIGLWQIGEGSWIYAKARLAQYLLQRAWSRTLAGETSVKPWPWADTSTVARLLVPSLNIDQIVLEGAYGRTLAFGPGHVESPMPIEHSATVILTGHRDTHFAFVQRLRAHDEILLHTPDGSRRRYAVEAGHIVDSRTASIALNDRTKQLVLVTCYPFDAIVPGGPLRYVVTALMVEDDVPRPTFTSQPQLPVPRRSIDEPSDTESAARRGSKPAR